jgi:hypothetical protein
VVSSSRRNQHDGTGRTGTGAVRLVGVLLLVLVAAGCSSSRDDTVQQAAEVFHAALRSQDGASACDSLADQVQAELQQSSGTSCEVEILESGVSTDGQVQDVNVSGTAAQVRYDDDIIFLAEFEDGWKIIGAGCERQAGGPYDCHVQGG